MRNRIIDISQSPARLKIQRRQLVITTGEQECKVPLDDLAVLIVAHPAVTYTQAVISEIASAGGLFITCDEKRMPNGMLLPLDAHSTQTQRFHQQIALKAPQAKQLWKQLIKAKIGMQASVLEQETGSDGGLLAMIPKVRSGDPANIEAQAARRYWSLLFGSDFRRDRFASDQNSLLNFGYAIVRSAIARSLCAAGLHPSIGVHHHNKYNAYCLADDMMEPFRPLVDQAVLQLTRDCQEIPELSSHARAELLELLMIDICLEGQSWEFLEAVQKSAGSLGQVISGAATELLLPESLAHAPL